MIKLVMRYGKSSAIDNLSMNIGEDNIYCLLGCNGAGKTALMKMIDCHVNPCAGDIEVSGSLVSTAKMPCDVNFISKMFRQLSFGMQTIPY